MSNQITPQKLNAKQSTIMTKPCFLHFTRSRSTAVWPWEFQATFCLR